MSWAKNPLEFSKTSVFSESVWGCGAALFPGLYEGLFVTLVWTILGSAYGSVIQVPPSESEGGGDAQIASQRGWDEMRSTVLKTLAITWVSCGVCNRVYGVKMKIVDAVKIYISLLMQFSFPLNCSTISRQSHGTQHRYTIASLNDFLPHELLKRCSQTQQTFLLSGKLG